MKKILEYEVAAIKLSVNKVGNYRKSVEIRTSKSSFERVCTYKFVKDLASEIKNKLCEVIEMEALKFNIQAVQI